MSDPRTKDLCDRRKRGPRNGSFDRSKVLSSPALGTDGLSCGSTIKRSMRSTGKRGQEMAFETGGKVYSSPAVGKGNLVLIGSADGRFYAKEKRVNRNGNPIPNFSGGINSSAALAFDDTLFVGGMDKKNYALNAWTGKKKGICHGRSNRRISGHWIVLRFINRVWRNGLFWVDRRQALCDRFANRSKVAGIQDRRER